MTDPTAVQAPSQENLWSLLEHIGLPGILLWLLKKYWARLCIFLRRQKLLWFPPDFNIGLSFDYTGGTCSVYFEEVKKQFLSLIDDYDLNKYIKIKDFSVEQRFVNKEEAQSFMNGRNIDLIIWGTFSDDRLKSSGRTQSNLKVNFTYNYKDTKEKHIGKFLALDIQSKLAQRNYWQIIENNSLEDTIKISNNIFDIGVYILARSLQLSGRLKHTVDLLEKICLKNKNDLAFTSQIKPVLIDCYRPLAIEAGMIDKNFLLGKEYCLRLLEFIPNDFFSLCNLAIFSYQNGDIKESEEYVDRLLKDYSRAPVTHVNVAFIRILQKNYSNAFKHYQRLLTFSTMGFNPIDVIEFLALEYDKIKDPAILFASGFISYHLGDKVLGVRDLEQFIVLSNERQYKKMYRNAKSLIAKSKMH